jgi:hypothetical protein
MTDTSLQQEPWWQDQQWQNKETRWFFGNVSGNQVYDFTGKINSTKLAIIQSIDEFFTKLLPQYGLQGPEYLIFDDEQVANHNSGLPMNGQVVRSWNAIHFYPACFLTGKYRGKEISQFPDSVEHFTGVLIHEYSHFLEPKFTIEWQEKFGWIHLESPISLSQHSTKYKECMKPENCISHYSLFHSEEDFCESMVALLLCPDKLKEVCLEKYEFLQSVIHEISFELKPELSTKEIELERKWPTL